MAWMWARLHARTTRLGTFEGGFQAFADLMAKRLKEMGVELKLNTAIQSVESAEGGKVRVVTEQGGSIYDQVLATTSPALLAKLAPALPEDYLDGLLSLKSMGAVVMVLSLKHQLSEEGYYWYNIPKTAGFPFLSLVEHTNFLSSEHFGGDHILYIGDYLPQDHENFDLSKEEILAKFLPHLVSSTRTSNRIGSRRPGCSAPAMPSPCHWSTIRRISPRFRPRWRAYISPA